MGACSHYPFSDVLMVTWLCRVVLSFYVDCGNVGQEQLGCQVRSSLLSFLLSLSHYTLVMLKAQFLSTFCYWQQTIRYGEYSACTTEWPVGFGKSGDTLLFMAPDAGPERMVHIDSPMVLTWARKGKQSKELDMTGAVLGYCDTGLIVPVWLARWDFNQFVAVYVLRPLVHFEIPPKQYTRMP